MNKLFSKVKKVYSNARFQLKAGKYMRVVYLQPRSVVLVTSRHKGKDNVLPLDWHMPLSLIPKMYCISLETGNYSSQMISSSKVFAVNFMSSEQQDKVIACGKISGKDTDKFAAVGFEKSEAVRIDAPALKDAIGRIECRLVNTIITGDHTLFIGEVVYEQISPEIMQLYHISDDLKG